MTCWWAPMTQRAGGRDGWDRDDVVRGQAEATHRGPTGRATWERVARPRASHVSQGLPRQLLPEVANKGWASQNTSSLA